MRCHMTGIYILFDFIYIEELYNVLSLTQKYCGG